MGGEALRFFAPAAWVNGAWAPDVVLCVGADGAWSQIICGASAEVQGGAQRLPGPVLPHEAIHSDGSERWQ